MEGVFSNVRLLDLRKGGLYQAFVCNVLPDAQCLCHTAQGGDWGDVGEQEDVGCKYQASANDMLLVLVDQCVCKLERGEYMNKTTTNQR